MFVFHFVSFPSLEAKHHLISRLSLLFRPPLHNKPKIKRHLSLLLTSAERAWSRAQEAKLALESGPDMSKKRVLLSRSAKAASWGRELAAAASAAGDSRTAVEGAAYASWLEGLAAMERAPGAGKRGGDGSSVVDAGASAAAWSSALEALACAGELCSRLAASSAGFSGSSGDAAAASLASPADARAAARAQAADIAPLVRFCQHQLGRARDASSSGEETPERVAAAAAEGAGAAAGPKVKAALEELRAGEGKDDDDDDDSSKKERPSSSSSPSSSTFAWRGSLFSVPSERARTALAAAQAATADARKVGDDDDVARLAALDRALAAFGDAKGIVRQQQQQQQAGGGGATAPSAATSSYSSADAARAAADARSLALAVTGAALDAALERGRLAASLLSRALDGGEREAATIFKVKQAALAATSTSTTSAAAETATATTPSASTTSEAAAASASSAEKKKKQQRRRAAAAAKRPSKPEDAVRAYASLAKTAKQLGEVAAALGGTTGELLLDEAAALGADASARRTFWAARAFLASRRCPDAMALLDRARERAEAAAEAHEECSRPDAAAVLSLRSLAEDACPGWKAVAHAEAAARSARGVRAAGSEVAGLKVAGKKKKKRKGGAASDDDDDDEEEEDDDGEEEEREQKRPFLMDRLDEWASCAPNRIAPIPPRLETVPVRPFVLDVAFDGVVPPDVSKRVGKAARGGRASSAGASSASAATAAAAAAAGTSEEESAGTLSKLAGAFGWGSK